MTTIRLTLLSAALLGVISCSGLQARIDGTLSDLTDEVNKAVAAGYLSPERGAQYLKDANDNAARIKELLAQIETMRAAYESTRAN